MKLWKKIFGSDEVLELADRRLFLLGATVTAAGLVVPRTFISIATPRAPRTFYVASAETEAYAFDGLAKLPKHATIPTLAQALAMSMAGDRILMLPGHCEVISDPLEIKDVTVQGDNVRMELRNTITVNGRLHIRNSTFTTSGGSLCFDKGANHCMIVSSTFYDKDATPIRAILQPPTAAAGKHRES